MKKLAILCLGLLGFTGANAQGIETMKENDIFNHLGVAVGVGTTGITIDAGTTITPWVQLRAGVDIMPKFKLKTDLSLEEYGVSMPDYNYNRPSLHSIDVQGQLNNTTGHVLFDIFPLTKWSSFHITVGGYFGGDKVINAYNTSGQEDLRDIYEFNNRLGQYADVPLSEGKIGAALGDYLIEPDRNGNIGASIRVKKFRPYVGLGFGRIVPNSRINCLFDLGVQFWGHPQVWNDTNNERLVEEHLNGSDGGLIKAISKISVYPVLSVKLVGKIF